MSLIQSIIGSAVGASAPILAYPAPGSNYPSGEFALNSGNFATATGFYPWQQFQTTNPQIGLWRTTYTGTAVTDIETFDSGFPSGWNQVRSELDAAVGFGYAVDGLEQYTMQWLGYFVPESDGEFAFALNGVDDNFMMWLGAEAVSGYNSSNKLFAAAGGQGWSPRVPMLAGRWYPVRLVYTEFGGGNECSIVSGLNNTLLTNNNASGRVGYFKTDDSTNSGSFPAGLNT